MTSCMDPNNTSIVETEPLHENQEELSQETIPKHGSNGEEIAMLQINQSNGGGGDNHTIVACQQDPKFSMDKVYATTMENPYRETTVTVQTLKDKTVPQGEITPKPFKTFNQILLLTYLSIACCFCFGIVANRFAWKAKIHHGKGLYGLAQKRAKRALYFSYAALGLGFIIIIFIILGATHTI